MRIRESKTCDRQNWDAFVREHSFGSLQQSWVWGDFQEAYGFRTFRLIAEGDNGIEGLAQIFLYDMPRGKWYLYCPRGILITQNLEPKTQNQILDLLFGEIEKLAKENGAIFLRIDPLIEESKGTLVGDALKSRGRRAFKQVQPEETLMLDLSGSEDDILASMKSKWRYNIRLAGRKGVKIHTPAEGGIETFYKLAKKTDIRKGFHFHTKKYYQSLIEKLGNKVKIFVATYNEKPIAANIMLYFKDTAMYAHGASADEHKNLMAPHLLQWEAIKDAKERGFAWYDFFGIATEGEKAVDWKGITRFKMGFAPKDSKFAKYVRYIGAYDIVYSGFWYSMIKMVKKFKK